jgi:hypothetical protein
MSTKALPLALLFAATLPVVGQTQGGGTVELQCNPIQVTAGTPLTMRRFGKPKKIAGATVGPITIVNCTFRNDSSSTVDVGWEDIQLSFPAINFLDSFEAQLLLTKKQAKSFWRVLADLSGDGILVGAAFASPLFLVAKPVLDVMQSQIEARVPDETALIGALMTANHTLAPSGKGHVILLAANSVAQAYTHKLAVRPAVAPAVLMEIPNEANAKRIPQDEQMALLVAGQAVRL